MIYKTQEMSQNVLVGWSKQQNLKVKDESPQQSGRVARHRHLALEFGPQHG